jgi:hypothetical protein
MVIAWRRSLLVLLQVLASFACALASDSGNPVAPSPALDQAFTLKAGASAILDTENLRVEFDSVLSDSRCPRGAQCITAGEAVVRVWLSKAPTPRESRELKTTPNAAEAVYGAYRIRLVTLDPYPTADRTIRPSDYVVTLLVTRT